MEFQSRRNFEKPSILAIKNSGTNTYVPNSLSKGKTND